MNRRKSYLLGAMIVLGIVAVIWLAGHGAEGIASFHQPVDLYAPDTEYQAITAFDLVYAEYNISMGCFGEVGSPAADRAENAADKKTVYYYAVPVFDGEDTRWIGLAVTGETDAGVLDAITDETYAFLAKESKDYGHTTLSGYGTLKQMDEEMYGYMQDAFRDLGVYEDDRMTQYVLPLYVSVYAPEKVRPVFAGAVIVLVGSLVYLGMWLRVFIMKRRETPQERNNRTQNE